AACVPQQRWCRRCRTEHQRNRRCLARIRRVPEPQRAPQQGNATPIGVTIPTPVPQKALLARLNEAAETLLRYLNPRQQETIRACCSSRVPLWAVIVLSTACVADVLGADN